MKVCIIWNDSTEIVCDVDEIKVNVENALANGVEANSIRECDDNGIEIENGAEFCIHWDATIEKCQ